MISKEIMIIIDQLLPVYKKIIKGEYAIALAGAHAKGSADKHSDIDIYIYTQAVSSYEHRKSVFKQIIDSEKDFWISEDIISYPWGGSIDFIYHGYKIETAIKNVRKVEETIDNCLNGKIKIYPEVWTSNGYFNYINLSEIEFIEAIEDSFNILNRFKKKVKVYPEKLKKKIINEFWWKSKFWVNNFHYISAINRLDIVYTSRIISNTIQNIIQVLFALNEKYFYGDKKVELQLKNLRYCPEKLIDNLEFLLMTRKDIEFLKKQRTILNATINEIEIRVNNLN